MENTQKFIDFSSCEKCKHYLSEKDKHPCSSCKEVIARASSTKPLYFVEAVNNVKK